MKTRYFLTDRVFGMPDIEVPWWYYYTLVGSLLLMGAFAFVFIVLVLVVIL